jgi:periplasmic divalent cation tolerance protein
MSGAVVLLTTVPSADIGERIARALVDGGLAACVNVLPPMVSVYRWQGEVQQDRECQLVIKTAATRVEAVHAKIAELHPYDLPEFLVLPVGGGDPAYLAWVVEASTRGA